MTIAIGTKVQVNDNYLASVQNPDETVTKVRGMDGVVTGYNADFTEVTPSTPTPLYWDRPFLFYPSELTILEEAHPLQKEFAKS